MTILHIIQTNSDGSRVLAEPAKPVNAFDAVLQQHVADIVETLHANPIAVGLAAPQVGLALRLAVINLKAPNCKDLVLINPRVERESGPKEKMKESCMSVPNARGTVVRRCRIDISYQDVHGSKQILAAQGFLARVILHEIDHLDGILYTKRMEPKDVLEKMDFDELAQRIAAKGDRR